VLEKFWVVGSTISIDPSGRLLPLKPFSSYNFHYLFFFYFSQGDCHDAIALQLLLKLKRHLKVVYSLDDARCQVWFPLCLEIGTAIIGAFT